MGKDLDKSSVDIDNIDISVPTVDLEKDSNPLDRAVIKINPIEYRIKKFGLVKYTAALKNLAVAYNGDIEYRIRGCIDYYANNTDNIEASILKSVGSSAASMTTCAIITDQDHNFFVCSLNEEIWFNDVKTLDDYSGIYAGLTVVETGGRKYLPNMDNEEGYYKVNFIVTSDLHVLVAVPNRLDLVEGNANYYALKGNSVYSQDIVTSLIFAAKSGELEKYVMSKYYKGEVL